jgi:glycosyltransferase involved in cell wall biosynthesis
VERTSLPISVIIPAYNRASTVGRAVASAASQWPTPPAQIMVVDDGSRDGTAEAARSAGAQVAYHEDNRGAGASRNTGLDQTSQPWIAFLDSDDQWLPHHLASLWPRRADHVFVASSALRCSPGGDQRHVGPPEKGGRPLRSPADVATTSVVLTSAVLARRDAIEAVGGFRGFHGAMNGVEDVDLWLRLLEYGTGYVADEVSVLYHEHAGQMTAESNRLQVARREVLESYAERPWFRPELLDAWDGVMGWDAARLAQRSGDHRAAVRHLAEVMRRPARTRALLGELWVRHRGRRRSSRILPSGASTLAVIDPKRATVPAPSGFAVVVPPGRTKIARYAALVRRPAAALAVDGRAERLVARILGMRPVG